MIKYSFLFIIFSLVFFGCTHNKKTFAKYDLESGIMTYEWSNAFFKEAVIVKVYISEYGAIEYYEYSEVNGRNLFPILKKDSLEYVFVSDSIALLKQRGYDTVFEKLVFFENSMLYNQSLITEFISDTVVNEKKCKLVAFKISSTGQKGKAAIWMGVPIWVESELDVGFNEDIFLLEIDIDSEIPEERYKIMDYVELD